MYSEQIGSGQRRGRGGGGGVGQMGEGGAKVPTSSHNINKS